MIKLRVSDLDSWLAYADPQFEEAGIELEEILRRLRREEEEQKPIMKAGSALHSFLEHAKAGDTVGSHNGVVVDRVCLRFDTDFDLVLPAEREPVTIEHTFETPSGPVLLRGRIDARDNDPWSTVTDYKLSGSFDATRYARSPQWKAYSLMARAKRFKYLVFESKQDVVRDENFDIDVWIHAVHELVFWPYPEMEQEVKQTICELAAFVKQYVPGLVL